MNSRVEWTDKVPLVNALFNFNTQLCYIHNGDGVLGGRVDGGERKKVRENMSART